MDNKIGNISTIIKMVSMTFAGWIITALAAAGYNFGVDAATLASVIGAIIGLLLAYIDAKYPNSFKFLGNDEEEPEAPGITTDEQIQPIEDGDEDDIC